MLLHKELSYKINGVLFRAHNEIGRYCNEKQVCDRIELELKKEGILYVREYVIPVSFEGEKEGRNRVDFLIADEIILELKTKRFLAKEDYFQVKRYLEAAQKELAILVNFRDERIKPKRILRPKPNTQYS